MQLTLTGKSRLFFLFSLSLSNTLFFEICLGFFQPAIAVVVQKEGKVDISPGILAFASCF
jgi:hypothetical protein